jgi:hypothetical protein
MRKKRVLIFIGFVLVGAGVFYFLRPMIVVPTLSVAPVHLVPMGEPGKRNYAITVAGWLSRGEVKSIDYKKSSDPNSPWTTMGHVVNGTHFAAGYPGFPPNTSYDFRVTSTYDTLFGEEKTLTSEVYGETGPP